MNRSNWTVTGDQMLSAHEVQRLYAALADAKDLAVQRGTFLNHIRDYFLLRVLLESGVRVFELTAFNICDFTGNSLVVRLGKGGKKRQVLLTTDTQKALREFIKLKKSILHEAITLESPLFLSERKARYSTRGVRYRVKFWFARCGFSPELSCHSARHSYVSHLIASGIDLGTVRLQAGHASLSTTALYSHAVRRDLDDVKLYSSAMSRTRTDKEKSTPDD